MVKTSQGWWRIAEGSGLAGAEPAGGRGDTRCGSGRGAAVDPGGQPAEKGGDAFAPVVLDGVVALVGLERAQVHGAADAGLLFVTGDFERDERVHGGPFGVC